MKLEIKTPNKEEIERITNIFQDDNPLHKASNSRCCVQGDWLFGTYFSNLEESKISSNTQYSFDFNKMVKPESKIIFLDDSINSENGINHSKIEISKSFKTSNISAPILLTGKISKENLNLVFPNLISGSFIESLVSNYCISSGDLSRGGLFEKALEAFNLNIKRNKFGEVKSFIAYNASKVQLHNIDSLLQKGRFEVSRYLGIPKIEYLDENNPSKIKAKLEVPFYLVKNSEIVSTITKTITCAGLERRLRE